MTKQVDELLGTNDEDDELAQEYENEYQDELADEMNDASYYGRNAGEVLEELEENLDEEDDETEDYISNNPKPIGRIGEKFAKKYLEELFKINNMDLKVKEKEKDNDEHDLEIYGDGEEYLVEVKFSTKKPSPRFGKIHFSNNFDYLFLIWHPDNKFYFAILSKEDLVNGDYTTLENTNRKEDNRQIQRKSILDESVLNNLLRVLKIDKSLIDLSDGRKLEIYEEAEQETEIEFGKLYEDVDKSTLYYKLGFLTSTERGEIAQHSVYKFLKQYDANAENHDEGDFDILYKNKRIELKFSRLDTAGKFQFASIKPENFEFLFLIGLEAIDGKDVFYFYLMTKEEAEKKIEVYSENGGRIQPTKNSSRIHFVNHLTIEDIDNYIENH